MLKGQQREWDHPLGCPADAYHATPYESTDVTSNLLIHGRVASSHKDNMLAPYMTKCNTPMIKLVYTLAQIHYIGRSLMMPKKLDLV